MPEQHSPRWGSIHAAGQELDVSDDTVRRMIRRGDITAVRIGPRLIRVDLNSVRVEVIGGVAA